MLVDRVNWNFDASNVMFTATTAAATASETAWNRNCTCNSRQAGDQTDLKSRNRDKTFDYRSVNTMARHKLTLNLAIMQRFEILLQTKKTFYDPRPDLLLVAAFELWLPI